MPTTTLSRNELDGLDAYWRAANYLTVGQIYLQDNPLLREPLRPEHIKPRLLGHWGTPELSFIYVHLNRLIRTQDVNAIYLTGPGHGGPAPLANVYLEGTYSEIYPRIAQDVEGLRPPTASAEPPCGTGRATTPAGSPTWSSPRPATSRPRRSSRRRGSCAGTRPSCACAS